MNPEVERWIKFARSDLETAREVILNPSILNNIACFHAQQCVEKSLKAVFIEYSIEPQHIHDIRKLLMDLSEIIEIPQEILRSYELTVYAVMTRYPGDWTEVNENETQEAIKLAEQVLNWSTSQVS